MMNDMCKARRNPPTVVLVAIALACALIIALSSSWNVWSAWKASSVYSLITEKEFACDELRITLRGIFTEESRGAYDAVWCTDQVVVFVLEEPFSSYEGFEECTLEDYGKLVANANNFDGSVSLTPKDDFVYYELERPSTDGEYIHKYYGALYRSENSFWHVQFVCEGKYYDGLRVYFEKWASSVHFVELSVT